MSDSIANIANNSGQVTPVKKRVIIGIPGSHFTHNFLLAWTKTLYTLWESGKYEVIIAPGQSSFVSFARMKTLGLDVLRGNDQKVFNNLPFDVYLTLDSDVVFSPQQIIELIESTDIHPVVSGYYMMADLQHFACVKDWNEEYFAKHGTFQFMKPEDIEAWKKETSATFMPVSYNGLGFWAMRKEALDSLKYPYFNAELQRIETGDGKILEDLCSEDVAFCKNLQRAGYQIMLHTGLRVGHEKSVIL